MVKVALSYEELIALIDYINPPKALGQAFFELTTVRDKLIKEYQELDRRI